MFFYFYSVFSYSEPDWAEVYVELDQSSNYCYLFSELDVVPVEDLDPDEEPNSYYLSVSAGPYPHFTKEFPRETYSPYCGSVPW